MALSETLDHKVIQHVLVRVCVGALGQILEVLSEFICHFVSASCACA